jgi:hypothetical protein
MLLREIADASGLPLGLVKRIANQSTWAGIKLDHAQRFAMACGVDLLRPRNKLFYLRRVLWHKGEHGIETLALGLTPTYVRKQIALAARQRPNQKVKK